MKRALTLTFSVNPSKDPVEQTPCPILLTGKLKLYSYSMSNFQPGSVNATVFFSLFSSTLFILLRSRHSQTKLPSVASPPKKAYKLKAGSGDSTQFSHMDGKNSVKPSPLLSRVFIGRKLDSRSQNPSTQTQALQCGMQASQEPTGPNAHSKGHNH